LKVFGHLPLFFFFESALLLGVTLVVEPSTGLQGSTSRINRYIGAFKGALAPAI
jgi:hypothetical protein